MNCTVENQGCIRRIEMLEDQTNEYATGLVELGNHAEAVMQERNAEYSEEIQRLKHEAEAYVGSQNEDITRLRHEVASVNLDMNSSSVSSLKAC